MKRIVMAKGGVETLEFFSYQMAKTFEKKGYSVCYFDLQNEIESAQKLRKFIRQKETAFVTFNFEGLEKEKGIYKEGIGYIWDEYQIPCYNIVVDHPYYYHNRLKDLPKKYHHISIDGKQAAYFKAFYPEYDHLGFLPLAGTPIAPSGLEMDQGLASMDVILTGNFTPTSFCESYIYRINEEYAAFYMGIIEDLIAFPEKTVEEVAIAHCKREMGEISRDDMRLMMHNMIFIDMYVRNYWRGEVVKSLVNAGINVDVFGKGWDKLDCKKPEYLHIHSQTSSLDCLRQISRAKLSLNVMPWFKDGAHDRVFNSILNGTISLTDKSEYLCRELNQGESVWYYDLKDLDKLPELAWNLLKDEQTRQQILGKGLDKVSTYHTWEARAEQLIQWFE